MLFSACENDEDIYPTEVFESNDPLEIQSRTNPPRAGFLPALYIENIKSGQLPHNIAGAIPYRVEVSIPFEYCTGDHSLNSGTLDPTIAIIGNSILTKTWIPDGANTGLSATRFSINGRLSGRFIITFFDGNSIVPWIIPVVFDVGITSNVALSNAGNNPPQQIVGPIEGGGNCFTHGACPPGYEER